MDSYPGYYSLIQYCPDLSRAEAANVGVVLFCPRLNFIDARTSRGNDRVRRFFRGRDVDLAGLKIIKGAIERRLRLRAEDFKSIDDLSAFIGTRANDIVLTAPRPMKVGDPQADLDQLFAELVGGRQRRQQVETDAGFELRRLIEPLAVEGRVFRQMKVRIPVMGAELKAPYAYRNGALNLIKPLPFTADRADDTPRKAGTLAIEGDLLARHSEEQLGEAHRLVVISEGHGPELQAREAQLEGLFREYQVGFVRRSEIPKFVEHVREEAHR